MKKSAFVLVLILLISMSAPDSNAQSAFTAKGKIESTNGGFKFPDGSIQTTASVATSECIEINSVPTSLGRIKALFHETDKYRSSLLCQLFTLSS
ncbi:MAG: hypothetical protein GY697_12260 [Desulfobacterales bacterium]|nr:hypothetical protein [Desulfobacterales bacterium]